MNIKSTKFIGSFNNLDQCPKTDFKEFAFIGRSNVGKSSLINFLTQKKDLAKVSNTPGKTQSINFFLINESWHLIDLPGYGFAKRSRSLREDWEKMMQRFFLKREQLHCVMQLIDSRIPPQTKDLEHVNWLGANNVPFVLVFTKVDKKERAVCLKNIQLFKNELLKSWEELPPSFLTSSEEKIGREEVMEFLANEL